MLAERGVHPRPKTGLGGDESLPYDEMWIARAMAKWVLLTNTNLPTAEVALSYKQLWMVEDVFCSMKSVLETRPIYHKRDETTQGGACILTG
jgi:transposase